MTPSEWALNLEFINPGPRINPRIKQTMQKLLNQAVDLAISGGGVLIATAGPEGVPHITSAGQTRFEEDGRISVKEWFCPQTLDNLAENTNVSVLIYDPATKEGHQIIGRVEGIKEVAMMDGFFPGQEPDIPQTERELIIRVDAVLAYRHGAHTDRHEE